MLSDTLSVRPPPPVLTVEEHDVLRDRVAPDAQFVGRKVGVGIADGQGAYDRKFRAQS
jgi:hypothetical protein